MKKSVFLFICLILNIFCITTVFAVSPILNRSESRMVTEVLASQDDKAIDDLIKSGLNLNSRDSDGNTLLLYTLENNDDLLTAYKLITAGADVNAPSANGKTPIILATSTANELTMQKNSLENMKLNMDSQTIEKKVQEQIKFYMERAETMLQMLLEKGADVNQETPMGTPLMNAATNEWNKKIIQMLIEAGANIDQQDQNGRTALFYAHAFGCDNIENMLIKAGANVGIKDKNGFTYIEVDDSKYFNH